MMKYKYSQLSVQPGDPSKEFSIRLLHLLPSTDRDARLECQLIETQIPDYDFISQQSTSTAHDPCKYQALSYTWGEPRFPQLLHVLPAGIINITENLHSALQALRKPDKTLILWVDAVCIDQSNIPERNSQVSNITRTYAEAAGVLVWLGTDNDQHDGQQCLGFFAELAALIASGPDGQIDEALWRARLQINQAVSKFLNSVQPGPIVSFLARPWFRRRWIVQEVVLAIDVAVYCGESSIPWNTFEIALTELFENNKGGFSDENRTILCIMSRIRHAELRAKEQVPLDTLVEFASFLCANHRDRLYAMYGVIQHWFSEWPVRAQIDNIDYSQSIGDIFTNFAISIMRLNVTMEHGRTYNPTTHVLQLAAAIQQPTTSEKGPSSEEVCENIPSWVPDWTGTLTNTPLNHSPMDRDASSSISQHPAMILNSQQNTRLLVSTGLIYDIVTGIVALDISPLFGAAHEAKVTLNDFLASVANCFEETDFFGAADSNIYQPTGEHIMSALATALVANWEQPPPNSYFSQDPKFPSHFLEQFRLSNHLLPEILHKWPAYVELITIMMRGRSLFLTKLGYIGICASNVLAGDVVCILSDTKIPFILRQRGGMSLTMQDGFLNLPDCYQFQNKYQFPRAASMAKGEPLAHPTYQLMGDTYVHGLMNGQAAEKHGWKLGDALTILPIS